MKRTILILIAMVSLIISVNSAYSESAEGAKNQIIGKFLAVTGGKIIESRNIGDLEETVIERTLPNGKKKKEIFYSTENYLIYGSILDADMRNLTQERLDEIDRIDFSTLPLNDAIAIKKGNGSKKLAMFTDVDCSFCRRAHEALSSMNDYILYVFLYPLDFHPKAKEKSIRVLCSEDKAKALDDAKHDRPISSDRCKQGEEMLAKHILTGTVLELTGTPLFILEDGKKMEGFNKPLIESYLLEKKHGGQ
ncbi:MAG: hypothetical protein A2X55_08870 [Nitrospirae bacterium GWB2_47_37]|nr:MAG: hypothetical protein A2X55_08870 [Nitrospirae bacterium GWB2_47_37]HAK87623.1 hypothetical protein [Nitrospiraceae bacterium]